MCCLLLLTLCPGSALAAEPKEKIRLGILYFDYLPEDEYAQLRKGLAQMLITDLANDEAFDVVERSRLEELIGELELQQTRRIDKSTAVKVGKLMGARYLVKGNIMMFAGQLHIDAHVMDVETGVNVEGFKARGKAEDFFEFQQNLSAEMVAWMKAHAEATSSSSSSPSPSPSPKRTGVPTKTRTVEKEEAPPAPKQRRLTAAVASRYGRALDAVDRKDRVTAKKELEAVLQAQPDFALARADLALLAR